MASDTTISKDLASKAKCYKCIPRGKVKDVLIYLLCQWLKKKEGPVIDFSYEPASEVITWYYTTGIPHSGDLATLLSSDPGSIARLDFSNTNITAIHGLSSFPLLTSIDVSTCVLLTKLDASNCLALEHLYCPTCNILDTVLVDNCGALLDIHAGTSISILSLDLHTNHNLQTLDLTTCSSLDPLILTGCVSLTDISVDTCAALQSLDVHTCLALTNLDAANCTLLNSIDISGCTNLTGIDCSNCALNQAAVDTVLCAADANGAINGTLNITSNTAPSAAGLVCSANLDPGKGWTVTHD